jgi:ketosteroid isomerase-like protein
MDAHPVALIAGRWIKHSGIGVIQRLSRARLVFSIDDDVAQCNERFETRTRAPIMATSNPTSTTATMPSKPDSTHAVLERHLGSFTAGDLEALLSDYSDDSVLFTVNGPLTGLGPIRELMTGLFAEFEKPGSRFDLQLTNVVGEVGFIVWTARTADNVYELGTDTFVVRGGKIAFQSFVGQVVPRRSSDGGN